MDQFNRAGDRDFDHTPQRRRRLPFRQHDISEQQHGHQPQHRDHGCLPLYLTFNWRYESDYANFNNYNDRIHFGASTGTADIYGTNTSWAWIIGVVGGDQNTTNTFERGRWYFYNNTSTTTTSGFNTANMLVSNNMTLTTGVVYSISVTVDPATQTYSASVTDGTTTFSGTGLNFRNQNTSGADATNGASNLTFGGANTGTGHNLNWSIDSINIVPEPSSGLLAGLSGLLCFVRRRIAH